MAHELTIQAKNIRKAVLHMVYEAQASHIGSCFSCVEILTALYFKILRIRPENPSWPNRDRFILSKGHAAPVLYAVLAEAGFFPKKRLQEYGLDGSLFSSHPVLNKIPGIEASTGSLGHGLAIGAGLALAAKHNKKPYRTFVLLSDGECDEGAVWETALFGAHHQLDNLIAIIDYNKIQAFGRTNEILNLEPLKKKWQAFGWSVKEVDGHSLTKVVKNLSSVPWQKKQPSLLIAHTVKGKGVSFIEDSLFWHYHSPDKNELEKGLKEIDQV